jgi:hypothetical protein
MQIILLANIFVELIGPNSSIPKRLYSSCCWDTDRSELTLLKKMTKIDDEQKCVKADFFFW